MSTENQPVGIPADYPINSTTWVRRIGTTKSFRPCNCASQPEQEKLRYVQNNRHLFELVKP